VKDDKKNSFFHLGSDVAPPQHYINLRFLIM
jgi:hypothetical protein